MLETSKSFGLFVLARFDIFDKDLNLSMKNNGLGRVYAFINWRILDFTCCKDLGERN